MYSKNKNDKRKFLHLFVCTCFFCVQTVFLFAQITPINQSNEAPCYEKANEMRKKGLDLLECGKLAGVIDCNEELEYDYEQDVFYRRAKDFVRREGVGQAYSGACETCFMSGLLERRIYFLNGREHGIDTTYYPSGCPQAIRSHLQGVESGMWAYYYDSTNQLAWEANYYRGKKHGRYVQLKANGDTIKLENYKNDQFDGLRKQFFKDSKPYKEANYIDGLLDGPFKVYNDKGILIEELNYKNNKKHGQQRFFYENGELLRTENWTNGVQTGEFKMFYIQGNVQTIETYDKKGLKEGKFEEYFPNQSPKRIARYRKDELIEDHHFDEHGNETYTFGGAQLSSQEDDDLPEVEDKKKKRKKRKTKKKKSDS